MMTCCMYRWMGMDGLMGGCVYGCIVVEHHHSIHHHHYSIHHHHHSMQDTGTDSDSCSESVQEDWTEERS